jgi:hypothetical protein
MLWEADLTLAHRELVHENSVSSSSVAHCKRDFCFGSSASFRGM